MYNIEPLNKSELEAINGGGPFYDLGVWVGEQLRDAWDYITG